jgi:hypothetical protein
MPSLGDYTLVTRVSGTNRPENNGYVKMQHGEEYSLFLENNATTRCDARITIDGQDMGKFRIGPRASIQIERPQQVDKKFHFYLTGTSKAAQAGIVAGASDNGHIEVEFLPERSRQAINQSYGVTSNGFLGFERERGGKSMIERLKTGNLCYEDEMEMEFGYQEGGTGLEGHSSQMFNTVGALTYDQSRAVKIHLRLVGSASGVEPLPGRRPLQTRIPPPVHGMFSHVGHGV